MNSRNTRNGRAPSPAAAKSVEFLVRMAPRPPACALLKKRSHRRFSVTRPHGARRCDAQERRDVPWPPFPPPWHGPRSTPASGVSSVPRSAPPGNPRPPGTIPRRRSTAPVPAEFRTPGFKGPNRRDAGERPRIRPARNMHCSTIAGKCFRPHERGTLSGTNPASDSYHNV